MSLDFYQYLLGCLSGVLVGFSLGLFGGGGSMLAVPLLIYLVGIGSPHQAIGTSAVAVAANSLAGIAGHARRETIQWRCAAVYGCAGVIGAVAGSEIGKAFDGKRLMMLFAGLMFVVSLTMLRKRARGGNTTATCTVANAPKVVAFGAATGLCSGFFGIGGGFLIVPGLIVSTGMSMISAIGTSLVVITAFGMTTAISYSISGLVIWPLALAFILGGAAGVAGGCSAAHALSRFNRVLTVMFACLILAVAAWIASQGMGLLPAARA